MTEPEQRATPLAPLVVGLLALGLLVPLVAYFALYSPSLTASEAMPSEAARWLRLHTAAFSLSHGLLLASLVIAVIYRRDNQDPRVPVLETMVVAALLLGAFGLLTGFRATPSMWGFNPWSSDPKLLLGTVLWTVAPLGGMILTMWARLKLTPKRRHSTLALMLAAVLIVSAASVLIGPNVRTMHPNPVLPGLLAGD